MDMGSQNNILSFIWQPDKNTKILRLIYTAFMFLFLKQLTIKTKISLLMRLTGFCLFVIYYTNICWAPTGNQVLS
jgi:hypothetical protein